MLYERLIYNDDSENVKIIITTNQNKNLKITIRKNLKNGKISSVPGLEPGPSTFRATVLPSEKFRVDSRSGSRLLHHTRNSPHHNSSRLILEH